MTEYEVEELKAEVLDLIMTMAYWPGNNDEKFWDIQCNTWPLLKQLKPVLNEDEYEKLYKMYEQAIMWG
ncbi:hypothetical protein [Veillonella sp. CHU594]|uniref:hypothetical protein n=1 Tax=Veillonella sp. CHU594 TaxID=2490948 RepID=UPI000F8DA81A|nr:hypothetical protein [Veillonella sp. CHU594]